jgi:hypothetical protein
VLAGVSYTGLAAAFVAKEYPGAFQRIISQSGSFWWNDCWLVEEFRRLEQRLPVEFYLDVGMQEIHENVRHPPHTRHAESVPYTIKTPGTYTLDGNLTYSGTSQAITVSATSVGDRPKGFHPIGNWPF